MSTANDVELLLITISLTTLCIMAIAVLVEVLVAINKIRALAKKAEGVIKNAESAAEALAHMGRASRSRFPLFSLFHSMFDNSKSDK